VRATRRAERIIARASPLDRHVHRCPGFAQADVLAFRTEGAEILCEQEHIEKDARSVAVAELARGAAMSTRTFLRRFKEATGNTPLVYVQRVRVEAAKRALEESQRSLATLARDVGYEDPVAFRRVFSRATGFTPADCRKRCGPVVKPSFILVR
jgi:transcriptional regulator GlxA family with amidase domain